LINIFGTENVYIIFASRGFTFDLKANYFVLVVISNWRDNQKHIMCRKKTILVIISLLCMYNEICNKYIYVCVCVNINTNKMCFIGKENVKTVLVRCNNSSI